MIGNGIYYRQIFLWDSHLAFGFRAACLCADLREEHLLVFKFRICMHPHLFFFLGDGFIDDRIFPFEGAAVKFKYNIHRAFADFRGKCGLCSDRSIAVQKRFFCLCIHQPSGSDIFQIGNQSFEEDGVGKLYFFIRIGDILFRIGVFCLCADFRE